MNPKSNSFQVFRVDLSHLAPVSTQEDVFLVRRNLEGEEGDLFALGLSQTKEIARSTSIFNSWVL